MKLVETTASKKAIKEIKEKIVSMFEDGDYSRFRVKFTKKKEFLVVPIQFNIPAFRLFLNEKPYKAYYLKGDNWEELD